MKFECDGISYDSDDMLQPRIEDKYIIALFITLDYACAFGTFMNPGSGIIVKRIHGEALESLSRRIHVPELLKVIDQEKVRTTT